MAAATDTIRYHVTGMDCASCAAKIEGAARKVEGVDEVKVSIASQIMTLNVDDPQTRLPAIEQAVTSLGYQLDRIGQPKVAGAETDEDDDKIPDLSHVTPAYKRALWIVVLLNVGYGVIEIFGSFLSGSQALQADALDFVGDGLISFLGLIAVGWGLAARAKAALRALAQSVAREFGPQGIHVGHVVVDGGIEGDRLLSLRPQLKDDRGPDGLLNIAAIADAYWVLHHQHRSAWTLELDLRPWAEQF